MQLLRFYQEQRKQILDKRLPASFLRACFARTDIAATRAEESQAALQKAIEAWQMGGKS